MLEIVFIGGEQYPDVEYESPMNNVRSERHLRQEVWAGYPSVNM